MQSASSPTTALTPWQLRQCCDPAQLGFSTTAELQALPELMGQRRAMDAVRFGAGIRHQGYNVYVMGPAGTGKRSMVSRFLETKADEVHESADWCYINNFAQPHKPQALRLPSGRGAELQQQMAQLVDYLRTAIAALFESDDYRVKVETIQSDYAKRQEQAFKQLGEDAAQQQIVLLRTPNGFAFAPVRDDETIPTEEFEKLPQAERDRINQAIASFQERLEKILLQIPPWRKERDERIKQLNRDTTASAVSHLMDEVRLRFADLPEVVRYLDAVQQDMIDNADDFRRQDDSVRVPGMTFGTRESWHRYQVNLLVTKSGNGGPPVVSEDNPTYANLVGRVEHIAQLGALITDFTLIKPGALHRANGGYLLLDIRKLLAQPFAWEGLKRALQTREIRIESLGQMVSLVSTVSLEPEPMALDVKVILFGERMFYYLLLQYDPEFAELFKVVADFEEQVERNADTHAQYARLLASICAREKLLPLDCAAVAGVIDHGARLVGDAERLSTHMQGLVDLLQESDYWARQAGLEVVGAVQVQQAIDAQIHRQDRLRSHLHDAILRNTLLIDTQGAVVGQINALSVLDLGGFAFAQPTRITATTRLGEGEMVNIEREVKLSGAIHSKGVLILSAFLAARYAPKQPLALSASLVFEQTYGQIDGDSASMAELCVLLSSLSQLPLRQSWAITGSVNQFGQAQAIGAVNDKIEGFFDVCQARGLTGEQGVLIPTANVKHLMLRRDVVQAVQDGRFQVHAFDDVDQAMSLLSGEAAGQADAAGAYPANSINGRVAERVAELGSLRKSLLKPLPGAAES